VITDHVQLLLNSFAERLGRELIMRTGTAADQAERLFHAPFVVAAHGTEIDPVLNYWQCPGPCPLGNELGGVHPDTV
jgi:hypothetical protein